MWIAEAPSEEDLQWLKKQALEQNAFDVFGIKFHFWKEYAEGRCKLVCKTCPYGKVLVFVENGKLDPTPYEVWGKIFQLFGHGPWRVAFFPSTIKRQLPVGGGPLGPEHVNGGYAVPCHPDTVVIYRKEEATRVLLHELFHASCCDRDLCLEEKEAETEAWAELANIAFASGGNLKKAHELLQKQLDWIASSHHTLQRYFKIHAPTDYVWRYTLGREPAFLRLGIVIPQKTTGRPKKSNRLTHPDLEL